MAAKPLTAVAIVQARMRSTRFPGKSLAEVDDWTVLGLLLARLTEARELDEVVVATTDRPTDDVLEVVGSGSLTVVDPSDMEFSNLFARSEGEPICLVNVHIHFLVDGWSFDLHTRKASHRHVLPG